MKVRHPRRSDFLKFWVIWKRYVREMREYDYTLRYNLIGFVKFFFARDVYHYLLFDGKDLEGFISVFSEGHNFCVLEAYISPPYRGIGIGEKIVEHIKEIFDGSACLYVFKENTRAKKFWFNCFAECNPRVAEESLLERCDFLIFEKGRNWWDG